MVKVSIQRLDPQTLRLRALDSGDYRDRFRKVLKRIPLIDYSTLRFRSNRFFYDMKREEVFGVEEEPNLNPRNYTPNPIDLRIGRTKGRGPLLRRVDWLDKNGYGFSKGFIVLSRHLSPMVTGEDPDSIGKITKDLVERVELRMNGENETITLTSLPYLDKKYQKELNDFMEEVSN